MNMAPDRQIIMRSLEAFDAISRLFAPVFEGDDGITKQELFALESVSRQGKLTMSGLANSISINMSTATGIVDRLIEKKLAKRERDGSDRRIVSVVLAERGKETVKLYHKQKKKTFESIMGMLSESEQESLVRILEKIAGLIQKR